MGGVVLFSLIGLLASARARAQDSAAPPAAYPPPPQGPPPGYPPPRQYPPPGQPGQYPPAGTRRRRPTPERRLVVL